MEYYLSWNVKAEIGWEIKSIKELISQVANCPFGIYKFSSLFLKTNLHQVMPLRRKGLMKMKEK